MLVPLVDGGGCGSTLISSNGSIAAHFKHNPSSGKSDNISICMHNQKTLNKTLIAEHCMQGSLYRSQSSTFLYSTCCME